MITLAAQIVGIYFKQFNRKQPQSWSS